MTKQQMIHKMKSLALEMGKLVDELNVTETEIFFADPPTGGGGKTKFEFKDPRQFKWLEISKKLIMTIAYPHLTKKDIKTAFEEIGQLGALYIERFKSDDVS